MQDNVPEQEVLNDYKIVMASIQAIETVLSGLRILAELGSSGAAAYQLELVKWEAVYRSAINARETIEDYAKVTGIDLTKRYQS